MNNVLFTKSECINGQNGNAILTVSFEYEFVEDTDTVATNEIRNILYTTADTFIQNNVGKLTRCTIMGYNLYITLNESVNEAQINATICFNCSVEEVLKIEVNNTELQKDFVDTVRLSTSILIVLDVSASIQVDVVDKNKESILIETTTTTNVLEEIIKNEEPTLTPFDDLLMVLLFGMIAFLMLIVCGLSCLYIYCKKRMQTNTKHMEAGELDQQRKIEMIKCVSASENSIGNSVNIVETERTIDYTSTAIHKLPIVSIGSEGSNDMMYPASVRLKMWLDNIGMMQHYKLFLINGFGEDILKLKDVNDSMLINMGIRKLAHRKLILMNINLVDVDTKELDLGENEQDEELYDKWVNPPNNKGFTMKYNDDEQKINEYIDEDDDDDIYDEYIERANVQRVSTPFDATPITPTINVCYDEGNNNQDKNDKNELNEDQMITPDNEC